MTSRKFDPENNDTHAFAKLLVHHFPHDRMVSSDELNWAMQWLRRKSLTDAVNRNNDDWAKDLRALRLHGYDTHRLDRNRAIKVSGFIWSHEGEEPSFAKLFT